ncbi:MAG: DUF3667 domain-containing protein [Saprospiraceae bacterium]|nr:DUF3667 domain-containing protein [Saprospiraceae bacterium]
MDCKNCGAPLMGEYCHQCGQRNITERFTIRQIIRDLVRMITNVDSGFWYTMRELFVRPATVVESYLSGATRRYYNPFRYYFLIIAVSALIQLSLGIFDLQQAEIRETLNPNMSEEELQMQLTIMEYVKKFLNIIPLFILPFIALAFKWMYPKGKWNYAEFLISTTFIYGQTAIIGLIPLLVFYFIPQYIGWGFPISLLLSTLYSTYTYQKAFQISVGSAFIRSLFATLIGFVFMFLIMGLVGIVGGIIYAVAFR